MSQYGPGLLDDPGRLRAVLSTLLPGRPRQVSALVAAVEDRVPAQLRANETRGVAVQAVAARLAASLADNRALDPAAAFAAVAWIAQALEIPGATTLELRPPAAAVPSSGWPTQPIRVGPPAPGVPRAGPPAPPMRPPPAKKKRGLLISVLVGVVALVLGGTLIVVTVALADGRNRPSPAPTPSPAGRTVSCTYQPGAPATIPLVPRKMTPPPAEDVSASGQVSVQMTTNKGSIVLLLDRAAAPCTVNSFVWLVQQKYFDDTACPRVSTTHSVLQCGDPSGTGRGGPGYTFPDENLPAKARALATYPAGTVAMALVDANTNGSQFFITDRDTQLPAAYSIFGKVTSGLEVVQDIVAVGSTPPGDGTPSTPIRIETVTLQR